MKADKDNKLRTLLKQAGPDQPAESFTDSVIQMIEADAVREAALKSLLKQHIAEGPSYDFTAAVMRQVTAQRKTLVIKPIITRKAWYAISAVFILFLIIAFLPGNADPNTITKSNRLTMLVDKVQFIPSTLVLAAVLGAILLIADYLFSQRRKLV
ncbi:MAG TPA: hypothetical protein VNW51_10395 [Mucilaginibacter sp.]|jgi:hypothetical protein|nr:hypothetical protein [Mucilaginibacter sp.]